MKKFVLLTAFILTGLLGRNQNSVPGDGVYEVKDAPNKAFGYGEKLTYRVHYGMLNGGNAHFEVGEKPVQVGDRTTYHIKVFGKSTGLVDVMFKVRDEFESFMDVDALVPWKATKKVNEGSYTDSDFIIFDHK